MTTTTESQLDGVRVSDAMRSGVLTCPPETPLRAVARMMATYGIHTVVVTAVDAEGEDEAPVSAVSSLDLTAVALAADYAELAARDAATTEIAPIRADETLTSAARTMSERRLEHLLVIDPTSGRPVGFLSTLDIARALAAP